MCQDHRESREDEETRDILGREDCQVTAANRVDLGIRVREVPVGTRATWESLDGMVMMALKVDRAKRGQQDLLEHLVIRVQPEFLANLVLMVLLVPLV